MGAKEDPGMVSQRWSALEMSLHMQSLKMPLHRRCGPHPGHGDKSRPPSVLTK